jgi:hypothetical protein
MECPICLGRGENRTPKTYRGLVIECGRCGVFRIMKAATIALPKLPIDRRLEALQKAKRFSSNAWPTISNACL